MLTDQVAQWNVQTVLQLAVVAMVAFGMGVQWARERYLRVIAEAEGELEYTRKLLDRADEAACENEAVEQGLRRELVQIRAELREWRNLNQGTPPPRPPRGSSPRLMES